MTMPFTPETIEDVNELLFDVHRRLDSVEGVRGIGLSHTHLKDTEDHKKYLKSDGSVPMTANLDMNFATIVNSGNQVLDVDIHTGNIRLDRETNTLYTDFADFKNIGGLTPGSVPFADSIGNFTEDNANFFWDDTSDRLIVNEIELTPGANDYLLTSCGGNCLTFQSQTADAVSHLRIMSFDGDGTDNVFMSIHGVGIPADVANRERLILGWDKTNTDYHIVTEAAGTGTVRALHIGTGANHDQFILNTDGTSTFGGNVSFGDNNITNVGDISLDSLTADGTDITVNSPFIMLDNVDSSKSYTTTGTAGTDRLYEITATVTSHGAASNSAARALFATLVTDGATDFGATGEIYALQGQVDMTANVNVDRASGMFGRSIVRATAGTVTKATGLWGSSSAAGTSTITDAIGILADINVGGGITQTSTNVCYFKAEDNISGTLNATNLYGLCLPAITQGTNNYTIYSQGGTFYAESADTTETLIQLKGAVSYTGDFINIKDSSNNQLFQFVLGGGVNSLIRLGEDATHYGQFGWTASTDKLQLNTFGGSYPILLAGSQIELGSTDNHKTLWGAGQDFSAYYDGTDAIINPKEVGTGVLRVLGGAVFNQDLDDVDFIIGGDTEANLFRVDAGTDSVHIGDWDTNYMAIEADGDINFVGGAGLQYGCINYHGAGSDTVLAAQDTFYQITAFDNNSASNGDVTPDHTNDHITVGKAGDYQIFLGVSGRSAASNDYEISVFKNNGATRLTPISVHMTTAVAGRVQTSSMLCFAESLSANDTIEAWVQRTDGGAVAKTFTTDHIVLNVKQIGG